MFMSEKQLNLVIQTIINQSLEGVRFLRECKLLQENFSPILIFEEIDIIKNIFRGFIEDEKIP